MSRFADVTSDTPHGPRPVPEGHLDADQVQARRPRPRKSGTSRLLTWGGVGLATVAAVMATRAVVDALTADPEDRPQRRRARPISARPTSARRESLAPRFSDMDEEDRRAVRARARAEFVDYDDRAADVREAALRERREQERALRRRHAKQTRSNFMGDFSHSAVKLATNITTLIAAANAAVDGFQQVSGKTDGIMRDFTQAADRLRGFFDTGNAAPAVTPDQQKMDDQKTGQPKATQTAKVTDTEAAPSRDRTHNL